MRSRRFVALSCAIAALTACGEPTQPSSQIAEKKALTSYEARIPPSLGGYSWTAVDLNDRGELAGSSSLTPESFATHAVRWTVEGVPVDLGVLEGGAESFGTGIANNGDVVGVSQRSSDLFDVRAVLWPAGGGAQDLGPVIFGGNVAVNDHEQIVWVAPTAGGGHEVRLRSHSGAIGLGAAVGGRVAINNKGQIVNGDRFWSPGTGWTTVPSLFTPSGGVFLFALNDRGELVGEDLPAGGFDAVHGVLWTSPLSPTDLGANLGPLDINNHSLLVGSDVRAQQSAFVRAVNGTILDLQRPAPPVPGSTVEEYEATAINSRGIVVGGATVVAPSPIFRLLIAIAWTPGNERPTFAVASNPRQVSLASVARAGPPPPPSALWCAQFPEFMAKAAGCPRRSDKQSVGTTRGTAGR